MKKDRTGEYFRATELAVGVFRADMALYLRKSEMLGQRFLLTRRGFAVGGLVPPMDLHALEKVTFEAERDRDMRLERNRQRLTWLEQAREKARLGDVDDWNPERYYPDIGYRPKMD